jgi:hypothetical protein
MLSSFKLLGEEITNQLKNTTLVPERRASEQSDRRVQASNLHHSQKAGTKLSLKEYTAMRRKLKEENRDQKVSDNDYDDVERCTEFDKVFDKGVDQGSYQSNPDVYSLKTQNFDVSSTARILDDKINSHLFPVKQLIPSSRREDVSESNSQGVNQISRSPTKRPIDSLTDGPVLKKKARPFGLIPVFVSNNEKRDTKPSYAQTKSNGNDLYVSRDRGNEADVISNPLATVVLNKQHILHSPNEFPSHHQISQDKEEYSHNEQLGVGQNSRKREEESSVIDSECISMPAPEDPSLSNTADHVLYHQPLSHHFSSRNDHRAHVNQSTSTPPVKTSTIVSSASNNNGSNHIQSANQMPSSDLNPSETHRTLLHSKSNISNNPPPEAPAASGSSSSVHNIKSAMSPITHLPFTTSSDHT